jgi:capsular exopolysaccharide synthesis family protein
VASKPEQRSSSGLLVAHDDPRSAAAEAYRALRTNIQFASPDHPIRTILATSTSAEDGKSTTIANLAITLAQAGHSTILVDCDLRRPSLHKLFGLANEQGLTSMVLDANAAATPPLQQTLEPNLMLLSSGPLPPNAAELLGSQRMQAAIATLKGQADFLLLDTPPIIAVTDAAVLAPQVDGVLLVINAGHTRRDLARRAKMMLEKVGANILGVVMNNAQLERDYYKYYGQGEQQ